jgi:hypothetical protein
MMPKNKQQSVLSVVSECFDLQKRRILFCFCYMQVSYSGAMGLLAQAVMNTSTIRKVDNV